MMNTMGFLEMINSVKFLNGVTLLTIWAVIVWVVWNEYKKYKERNISHIRNSIYNCVKHYSRLCRGSNRFVVTVYTLRNAFPEVKEEIIEKIWNELVDKRMIETDPMDGEWCVRRLIE